VNAARKRGSDGAFGRKLGGAELEDPRLAQWLELTPASFSLSELARGVHRATTTRITLLPPTTHTHTLLKHIDGPF
jgi:hypothetical protein